MPSDGEVESEGHALGALAAELSAAATPDEVAHALVERLPPLLGAVGGALGLVQGEELVIVDPAVCVAPPCLPDSASRSTPWRRSRRPHGPALPRSPTRARSSSASSRMERDSPSTRTGRLPSRSSQRSGSSARWASRSTRPAASTRSSSPWRSSRPRSADRHSSGRSCTTASGPCVKGSTGSRGSRRASRASARKRSWRPSAARRSPRSTASSPSSGRSPGDEAVLVHQEPPDVESPTRHP